MGGVIRIHDLGLAEYEAVWRRQHELCDAIAAKDQPETLLLVEHPHVITTGRGTDPKNVLSRDVPVHEIERGGDATYHGPGQLVGYPLIRVADHGLGLHSYLRGLEDVLIRVLATFGLRAQRVARKTGVWVGERKIASIGIAVRQGVSYHGFALNVNTDLSQFARINPCGFDAAVMTSMQQLLGETVAMHAVKHAVVDAMDAVFGLSAGPVLVGAASF
jgi:lipoyl(octanoyl) transferase